MSRKILVKDKSSQYVITAFICLMFFVIGFFYVNKNAPKVGAVQAVSKNVVVKNQKIDVDTNKIDFFLNLIMSSNASMNLTYKEVCKEEKDGLIGSGIKYLCGTKKMKKYISKINQILSPQPIDEEIRKEIDNIPKQKDNAVQVYNEINATPLLEEIKDKDQKKDIPDDKVYEDIIIVDKTSEDAQPVSNVITTNFINQIKSNLNLKKSLVVKKEKPYVLIYHTHATEVYLPITDDNFHSKKKEYSVMKVGEIIASELMKKGHNVKQVQTYHDLPSYSKSYDRSLTTIKKEMKEEGNIKFLLDIHRDGIPSDAAYLNRSLKESKVKVDNKDAATFKFVIGSDCKNKSELVNFAKYVMAISERMYPGLCKGLVIKPYGKFNLFVSDYAMLLEVGSNLNTIQEANYTAKLLSNVLDESIKNIVSTK